MTARTPHRILVIDDNLSIHDDFRKVLTPASTVDTVDFEDLERLLVGGEPAAPALDVHIDSALQGMEGLERVEQALAEGRPYSVAFVDGRMPPGWDGVETIEHLWAADPDLQVVLCTAYSDHGWTDIRRRLVRHQQLLILKKPFEAIEVLQMVACLTEKWALGHAARAHMTSLQADVDALGHRLGLILDAVGDAIIGFDVTGTVTFANPAAHAMLGADGGALIGRPWPETGAGALDLSRLMDDARRIGGAVPIEAQALTRIDGVSFPADGACSLLRDQSQVIGAVLALRDVSERQRAALELRHARDVAEAATRAKSAFLANMSHDMRTPLNIIIGMMDMLLDEALAAAQRDCAQRTRRSAVHLLQLVNDLLDLAGIEAGKIRIETSAFDIRTVLSEALDAHGPVAHTRGLTLEAQVAPNVPAQIVSDSARVFQILSNLIGNAIKFTDRGSVRVEISPVSGTNRVPAVRLAVRDTGIGIPPAQLDSVFESFNQCEEHGERRKAGVGLGLAICKQFATLLGGLIGVESEMGAGSTFWVELPVVATTLNPSG